MYYKKNKNKNNYTNKYTIFIQYIFINKIIHYMKDYIIYKLYFINYNSKLSLLE